jgi:hypothetical protein
MWRKYITRLRRFGNRMWYGGRFRTGLTTLAGVRLVVVAKTGRWLSPTQWSEKGFYGQWLATAGLVGEVILEVRMALIRCRVRDLITSKQPILTKRERHPCSAERRSKRVKLFLNKFQCFC